MNVQRHARRDVCIGCRCPGGGVWKSVCVCVQVHIGEMGSATALTSGCAGTQDSTGTR